MFNIFISFDGYLPKFNTHNINNIKSKINNDNKNLAHLNEIRKETTETLKNTEHYQSLVEYNKGNYKWNHKLSNGIELDEKEKKMHDDHVKSYDLIGYYTNNINLLHGFEDGMYYPNININNIYKFNWCLSKTHSWAIADKYSYNNKFLYVIYNNISKHICVDERTADEDEYEYLGINETLRCIDIVYQLSIFPKISLRTYYIMSN